MTELSFQAIIKVKVKSGTQVRLFTAKIYRHLYRHVMLVPNLILSRYLHRKFWKCYLCYFRVAPVSQKSWSVLTNYITENMIQHPLSLYLELPGITNKTKTCKNLQWASCDTSRNKIESKSTMLQFILFALCCWNDMTIYNVMFS